MCTQSSYNHWIYFLGKVLSHFLSLSLSLFFLPLLSFSLSLFKHFFDWKFWINSSFYSIPISSFDNIWNEGETVTLFLSLSLSLSAINWMSDRRRKRGRGREWSKTAVGIHVYFQFNGKRTELNQIRNTIEVNGREKVLSFSLSVYVRRKRERKNKSILLSFSLSSILP